MTETEPERPHTDPDQDSDAARRRDRILQVVDDHMDRHRELYDKLARE